jgi:HEAT repeat protein
MLKHGFVLVFFDQRFKALTFQVDMKLFRFFKFFKKKTAAQSTDGESGISSCFRSIPNSNSNDKKERRSMKQQSIQLNLVNSLKNGDEKARLYAIEELVEMCLSGMELSEKAIPVLLVSLLDNHATIQTKAEMLLGKWDTNWKSREAVALGIPALIEYLVSTSREKATKAFRLLRKLNTLALPELVNALQQTEDEEMQLKVVQLIGEVEGDLSLAVPPLITLLRGKNTMVKEAALKTLIKTGSTDHSLTKGLVESLEDQSTDIKVAALKGLMNVEQFDSTDIEAMVRCLLDANYEVRIAASKTLAGIGAAALDKTIALIAEKDLLRKQELENVKASKGSLFKGIDIDKFLLEPSTAMRNVSWHFKDILDALDRIEHGISLAVEVLGQLKDGSTATLEALESALSDFNPTIKEKAVSALGTIGPAAKNSMDSLLSLYPKADFKKYELLVRALNAIDPAWHEMDHGRQFLQFLTNQLQANREQLQVLLALKVLPKDVLAQLSSSAMKTPTTFNKEVIQLIAVLGQNTPEAELYINEMIQKEKDYLAQSESEVKRIGFKKR